MLLVMGCKAWLEVGEISYANCAKRHSESFWRLRESRRKLRRRSAILIKPMAMLNVEIPLLVVEPLVEVYPAAERILTVSQRALFAEIQTEEGIHQGTFCIRPKKIFVVIAANQSDGVTMTYEISQMEKKVSVALGENPRFPNGFV